MSVSQRLIHRHFIDIFQVAADGHAHGDARGANAERLEQATDVVGGGFAFGGGIGGQDDFGHCHAVVVFRLQARQQIGQVQFIWADVPNRRETAVQHMIDAFEAACFFDCHQAVGFFDNANHRMIARGQSAKATGIDFSQVVANRAENDPLLDLEHRRDQTFDVGLWHAHHMKRQPLRRFLADAGQALELIDEFGYWFGVFKHKEVSSFEFQVSSFVRLSRAAVSLSKHARQDPKLETLHSKLETHPSMPPNPGGNIPPILLFIASSILRLASLAAATIRSWSISTSPSLTASGSIFSATIS